MRLRKATLYGNLIRSIRNQTRLNRRRRKAGPTWAGEVLEDRTLLSGLDVTKSAVGVYQTQGVDANNGILLLTVADDTNSFANYTVAGGNFEINVRDLQSGLHEDAGFSMVYVPFANASTLGAPSAVYAADIDLRGSNTVVNSGPLPTVLGRPGSGFRT